MSGGEMNIVLAADPVEPMNAATGTALWLGRNEKGTT